MKNKRAVAMFGQKRLSREGGIEIVVKELCTRMARDGYKITCYNRSGHHVSGAEYDEKIEYSEKVKYMEQHPDIPLAMSGADYVDESGNVIKRLQRIKPERLTCSVICKLR